MALHAGVRGPGHMSRTGAAASAAPAVTPALKFNVAANSQYHPLVLTRVTIFGV